MFTGLVEAAVPVRSLERRGTGARLILPPPTLDQLAVGGSGWGGEPDSGPGDLETAVWSTSLGDSIAVSGACLTVAAHGEGGEMAFDLTKETLDRTWLGGLEPGRIVNLERALRLGDRLGGHMVSGHVDTVGRLVGRKDVGDGGAEFTFEVPEGFERYLVDKGSVTIDGISLTVVEPAGQTFQVAVIPHTLERTHLGASKDGDPIHLEADLVARWVERLVPGTAAS